VADALEGVKVGDELVLTLETGRKQTQSPKRVKVHKVGRKLVYILRYADRPDMGTDAYRIESDVINDNYGHTRLWFPRDWEAEQRRGDLTEALRRHGVEVWRGGRKSIRTLERLLAVMEEAE
jgi:hypothetical protein